MTCEFCGEEISEGALACPRCGSPVSKPADAAPQPAATEAAQQAPPVQQTPIEPPLAKLEEDFIALAEESVTLEENGAAAPDFDPGAPVGGGQVQPPDASAIADQMVMPGAVVVPQQVQLGNDLTGGYQVAQGGGSVAGAGEQTADDPFGLNITEAGPQAGKEWQSLRQGWRYSRWWNITVMAVGIVLLLVGVTLALYFGVFRKPGLNTSSPPDALKAYVTAVVSGNGGPLSKQAVAGSVYGQDISTLLKGYEKYGIMTVKSFDSKTVKIDNTNATVQVSKMEVSLTDVKGNNEVISVLDITEPFKLPTTVQMVQQKGEWFVSSP